MQQKNKLAREMEWFSPSLSDSGSAFEQACTLIDCAQGGLHCLIEAIRADGRFDARFDSVASGCLIQLEMAVSLLIESKQNGKDN